VAVVVATDNCGNAHLLAYPRRSRTHSVDNLRGLHGEYHEELRETRKLSLSSAETGLVWLIIRRCTETHGAFHGTWRSSKLTSARPRSCRPFCRITDVMMYGANVPRLAHSMRGGRMLVANIVAHGHEGTGFGASPAASTLARQLNHHQRAPWTNPQAYAFVEAPDRRLSRLGSRSRLHKTVKDAADPASTTLHARLSHSGPQFKSKPGRIPKTTIRIRASFGRSSIILNHDL